MTVHATSNDLEEAASARRRPVKKPPTVKRARVVGVRRLRLETAAVLDEVEAGTLLIVTNRGRSVAALVPIPYVEEHISGNLELAAGIFLSLNRLTE